MGHYQPFLPELQALIGNIRGDVTLQELHQALELHKFPGKDVTELLLAVDKKGNSRGYAFLQIPLSCSAELLKLDGSEIKGQAIWIVKEKCTYSITRNKRWVKSYKEDGMTKSLLYKPNLIYRYKPNGGSSQNTQESAIEPLYDMCAELTHKKFAKDVDKVFAESFKLGVNAVVIPGRCRKQRKEALDLKSPYSSYVKIYVSTGLAPSYANDYNEEEKAQIKTELSMDDCRCIGPIGLDFRLKNVSHEQQLQVFEEQLQLACQEQKPLYLVEHEAHKDFIDVLTKHRKQLPKCAIVDFTGTSEELDTYVAMGFYIVISASIKLGRAAISLVMSEGLQRNKIPKEKILLSSNAPHCVQKDTGDLLGVLISGNSCDKLPINSMRAEPLCIFLALEVIAKYLGYKEKEEIQRLANLTVKNSREFLWLNKPKISVTKKCTKTGGKVVHKKVKKVKILLDAIFLSVLLLAVFLDYITGIPEVQSQYFFHQTIF